MPDLRARSASPARERDEERHEHEQPDEPEDARSPREVDRPAERTRTLGDKRPAVAAAVVELQEAAVPVGFIAPLGLVLFELGHGSCLS